MPPPAPPEEEELGITPGELYQSMVHGERYQKWKKEFDTTSYEIDPDTEESVEAFILPSSEWSEHYGQLISRANHAAYIKYWPRWAKDDFSGGTHQAVVPAPFLHMMPEKEHDELYDQAVKVKDDYPLVDDDIHSQMEYEFQAKAWDETERERFKEFLVEYITGEVSEDEVDKHGERVLDRMLELLTNDKVDHIFYELEHNGSGDHWDDSQGTGDYSLNIDRLLDGVYIKDVPYNERRYAAMNNIIQELREQLYPEDPRQMKFGFANEVAETLLENAVDVSPDPSSAAKLLVATLLEGHDYSCLMLDLPDELRDRIVAWGKQQIPEESLFVDKDGDKGREEESHITVKYGLFDAMPSPELRDIIRSTKPFDVQLKPITLFRSKDYDVVKLDVSSAQLFELNRAVSSACPHHDTFPEYHPHVTIAYVKKGTCDRLEGVSPFDDPVKLGVTSLGTEGTFTAKKLVFSSHTDVKKEYALGGGIVDEGMSPEELVNSVGLTAKPEEMRTSKRRVGREIVSAVWITNTKDRPQDKSMMGGFGREGELRIYYAGKQATKQDFCSWEVLKMVVRQWRNLYGVRLFVNGKESGVVSYRNPALQDERMPLPGVLGAM